METGQFYQGIFFIAIVAVVIFGLVGAMFIKVGYDLSKLARNLDDTVDIVREELTPTLKNVNKSVEIVSGIIIKTDNGINKVKEFMSKTPFKVLSKLSTLSGTVAKGFFGGLCAGLKIFGKKK